MCPPQSDSPATNAQRGLDQLPVTVLKGVGPRIRERLARLGLHTVQDVLFHLPLRYEDRTRVLPLGALRPGESVVIEAEVQHSQVTFGRRRMLLVALHDGTGSLVLRFFNFTKAQKERLQQGVRLRCYGEVRAGKKGLEMAHPEHRVVGDDSPDMEPTLTPIYPATEGVHQLKLRDLTEQALALLQTQPLALPEWLPDEILAQQAYPTLVQALTLVHRPPPRVSLAALAAGRHPAQRRLSFEELLAHQLSLRQLRQRIQAHPAPRLQNTGLSQAFIDSLPFTPTCAQQRVICEIQADVSQARPMLRLVQGDVGCGKTVVAAAAALMAIEAGFQVALMAPTELLAEQHYRNFTTWLTELGHSPLWLSGKQSVAQRRAALARLERQEAVLVIGTHALFQEAVQFSRLGLVIIDEQHRFGVHQRLALREKGVGAGLTPHQLIMTATPIPRTLAMTAYADLDTSIIDELPPGRTPVKTVVIPDSRRDEVMARVHGACREGRQVYWVCTLIEESEVLQCQAASDAAEQLKAALPDVRVGLVHGRLKPADKEAIMSAFKNQELDLLVATTVIEVGVDVPNASLMIIENAERLGLAQLHQLRGRVGRGDTASSCVLMYHGPLSQAGQARLGVMRETHDGFVIAERDLELRGPGELLGTRQTGLMQFHVADLARDQDLLPQVQRIANEMLTNQAHRVPALVRRWLGDAARYGDV